MRVVDENAGERPVRSGDRVEGRELQTRGDRKLRLRATMRVMHQLVRRTGLPTSFGRIRLPLRGVQIDMSYRRVRMADGLMDRPSTSNHRLYDQAQHQQRQKRLTAESTDPAEVTSFHGCGV